MNFHRSFEPIRNKERKEPELRPDTRHPNADALLAEIKRLLDEDNGPTAAPGSTAPSQGRPESWQTQQQPDLPELLIGAVGAIAEGQAPTPEIVIGQHPNPSDREIKLTSRRWKLLASGLAISVVAVVGADYALKSALPDATKNSASVVASHGPTRAADEVAPPAAADAARDSLPHEQASGAGPDAPASSERPQGGAPPAVVAQTPDEKGSRPPAAPTPVGPAAGGQPGAVATAVSQPAHEDPARAAKPDESPGATSSLPAGSPGGSKSDGSAAPATPPKPRTGPASATDVAAGSAQPPAPKSASSTKPPAGKKADHKPVAKKKAAAAATAEASKARVARATPKPTIEPATADPAAAAPAAAAAAPVASSEQPAGGLPGAFGYLFHLPGALVQHVTNPGGDAK